MALISCPNCGQSISDKAKKCVHCGVDFNDYSKNIACPECGTEISDDYNICPVCGYPLKSDSVNETPPIIEMYGPQEDEIIYIQGETKPKKKKVFAIVSICIFLVLCLSLGYYAYYSIQKSRQEYIEKYTLAIVNISSGIDQAQKGFNQVYKVWYNTAYQIDDIETDYFTKDSNGRFYSDVSTPVYNSINNQYFLGLVDSMESKRRTAETMVIELKDYPRGFDDDYEAYCDLYDSYLVLIKQVRSPHGELGTYAEECNDAMTDVLQKLTKTSAYLKKANQE